MTPEQETREDPAAAVKRFVDAFNARQLAEQAHEFLHKEIVLKNKSAGQVLHGPDEVAAAFNHWLEAVPDYKGELVDYDVAGTAIECTLRFRGTFTGTMTTPDGEIPGTGKSFDVEARASGRVEDGKIVQWTSSYDIDEMNRQMGLA